MPLKRWFLKKNRGSKSAKKDIEATEGSDIAPGANQNVPSRTLKKSSSKKRRSFRRRPVCVTPYWEDGLAEDKDNSWLLLESPSRLNTEFSEPQYVSLLLEEPEVIELRDISPVAGDMEDNDGLQESSPSSEITTSVMVASPEIGTPSIHPNCEALQSFEQFQPSNLHLCEDDLDFPDPEIRLGSGAFGIVYQAKYEGMDVAVKKIDAQFSNDDMIKSISNELHVLSKLDLHAHVVGCYGGCLCPPCFFIVEELMETDLHHQLHPQRAGLELDNPPKPLPLITTLQVGIDIARGLAHLHPDVIHRDLKPQNILLKDNVAKVADFGLSRVKINMSRTLGIKGTIEYMSPESINGKEALSHKTDIYSLGIVLWECVTGLKPYLDIPNMYAIMFKVVTEGLRPEFPEGVICHPALRALIESCWSEDPSDRPSSNEIIDNLVAIQLDL